MTAPSSIDPARLLHEHLASASPDLLRSMPTTFINTLISAEADAVCGAAYGESSPDRASTCTVVRVGRWCGREERSCRPVSPSRR
jgi:transposase-like protein